MDKSRKNIVVIEPSKIIYEGLSAIILRSEYNFSFFHLENLNEINTLALKHEITVVLINPGLIQNQLNKFAQIKKHHTDIHWIGIIYSYFDHSILKIFDDTIQITDTTSLIIQKINRSSKNAPSPNHGNEHLSERETDVLQWLAKGHSNKEIAEKLNISIYTVNTHRKNIMDKTGIRSMAGLTIYAASKGIISFD